MRIIFYNLNLEKVATYQKTILAFLDIFDTF